MQLEFLSWHGASLGEREVTLWLRIQFDVETLLSAWTDSPSPTITSYLPIFSHALRLCHHSPVCVPLAPFLDLPRCQILPMLQTPSLCMSSLLTNSIDLINTMPEHVSVQGPFQVQRWEALPCEEWVKCPLTRDDFILHVRCDNGEGGRGKDSRTLWLVLALTWNCWENQLRRPTFVLFFTFRFFTHGTHSFIDFNSLWFKKSVKLD